MAGTQRNITTLIALFLSSFLLLVIGGQGIPSHSNVEIMIGDGCREQTYEPSRDTREMSDSGYRVRWSGSLRFNTQSAQGAKWLNLDMNQLHCRDRQNQCTLEFLCGNFNIRRWSQNGDVELEGRFRCDGYQDFSCNPRIRCSGRGNETYCGRAEVQCNNSPAVLILNELSISGRY